MDSKHIHFHFTNAKPKPPPKPFYVGVNYLGAYSALNSIRYSSTGSNWRNIASGGFGGGGKAITHSTIWVAVGIPYGVADDKDIVPINTTSSIQTSINGSNWQPIASGGFIIGNGLAYGKGLWVAVGESMNASSTIQYSSNASNWYPIATGGFDSGDINYPSRAISVAYGSSLFVAVGQHTQSRSTIQYSSNASNWYPVVTGGFNYSNGLPNKVVYGNGLWVAVGSGDSIQSSIQYSIDGSNWQLSKTFESQQNAIDIAYGNNIFVAAMDILTSNNANSYLQYSSDGSNWKSPTGIVNTAGSIAYTTVNKTVGKRTVTSHLWTAFGFPIQYSSNGSNWYHNEDKAISYMVRK